MKGHSHTGVLNKLDFDSRLYAGLAFMKKAPLSNEILEMSPVDYISSSIVQILFSSPSSFLVTVTLK